MNEDARIAADFILQLVMTNGRLEKQVEALGRMIQEKDAEIAKLRAKKAKEQPA